LPRRHAVSLVACGLALVAIAAPSRAANIFENVGTFFGSEFLFDSTVRSLAMGNASGAVYWGLGTNSAVNPSLLGLTSGIVYEDADVLFDFNSRRLRLGYGGIGFSAAGYPFDDLGGFDMGTTSIDPGGFFVSQKVRSWGIGASASGLASSIAAMRGGKAPAFTRYADFAVGYSHNRSEVGLGPPVTESHSTAVDWGLLARGAVPFQVGSGGRFEAAYSYSVQNANDGGRASTDLFAGPYERPHRHGTAARLALDAPSGWRTRIPAWLEGGLEPLMSVGGAWDREFISAGDGPVFQDRTYLGGELGVANLLFARWGQRDLRHYWGYGVNVPIGRLGGFQYDESRAVTSDGFPELKSDSWTVWVNPIEIASALR
jgi:hypothetical protein